MDEDKNHTMESEKQGINTEGSTSKSGEAEAGSTLLEATEYVEAVLSSHQVAAVLRTPVPSGRKRHLSLPAVGESDLKKIKSDDLSIGDDGDDSDADNADVDSDEHSGSTRSRNFVRARRNLLSKQTVKSPSNNSLETERILAAMGDLRTGLEQKIEALNKSNSEKIDAMTAEIEKTRLDFNNRMEGLAKKVEKQVMKSISKTVDSKMKALKSGTDKQMNKLQKACELTNKKVLKLEETTMTTMKEELGDEIDELHKKVSNLENTVLESCQNINLQNSQADRRRNIVIRNLEEREHENVLQRADRVVSEGLKLSNISFASATRKVSRDTSKPGLIIATCKNEQDKENIMSIKRELKNSSRYKNVFVENDIPPGQRKLNSNLRTIVNTIGRDRLHFRGSRVLPTETGQNTGSSYDTPDHSYNSHRRADENRPYRYDGGSARDDYNSRDSYRRHHNNYRTDRLRENTDQRYDSSYRSRLGDRSRSRYDTRRPR